MFSSVTNVVTLTYSFPLLFFPRHLTPLQHFPLRHIHTFLVTFLHRYRLGSIRFSFLSDWCPFITPNPETSSWCSSVPLAPSLMSLPFSSASLLNTWISLPCQWCHLSRLRSPLGLQVSHMTSVPPPSCIFSILFFSNALFHSFTVFLCDHTTHFSQYSAVC